jgi:hypothetical protein
MLGEKERRSSPAAPERIFPSAVHVASLFASLPIALTRAAAPAWVSSVFK